MAKEMLIWARHTRKWEVAHVEEYAASNRLWDGAWWVRSDFSHICRVGEEVATHPLPPAPQREAAAAIPMPEVLPCGHAEVLPCGHPNTFKGDQYISVCETCGAEFA